MSRIVLYQEQTEGQKKIPPSPVKIEREKEGRKNIEQKRYKGETKVFNYVEEIYSKKRYLGEVRKSKKYDRLGERI